MQPISFIVCFSANPPPLVQPSHVDVPLRHDADVSAGDEVAVLVAAVGREAPRYLLVVRRAEHVPDLVRRHRLVTVLGDPPEVAVVLDGHTFYEY